MNVLEVLRSDMTNAWYGAPSFISGRVAAFEVLDEFIAGHEVVEVRELRTPSVIAGQKGMHCFQCADDEHFAAQFTREIARPTIIVPREQKPTLLEAAAEVLRWRKWGPELRSALDALAAAIAEAQDE